MGGSAFGTKTFTPRMPHDVYRHMRDSVHAVLRELFVFVATPIEGPAKKDHGDIDVLVCLERRVAFPPTAENEITPRTNNELMVTIKDKLRAEDAIMNGPTANLLLPWPAELYEELEENAEGQDAPRRQQHVQVDVRICKDFEQMSWGLFKHAHGDMWNLIGSSIRPFGLTVDEEALYLRIPEIEKFDRKRAKVLLTTDPVKVIHFLGMQVEGFWEEPFSSVEALFEYVTTCRLFWVKEAGEEEAAENGAGVVGGEEGRRKLKSNDRRRMNGRPVYRQWINEYIPRLRAEGRFLSKGQDQTTLREALRDEAIAWFFVQAEYHERLHQWRVQRSVEEVKGLVKILVPTEMDNQRRAATMSALKKIILEDDCSFGFALPATARSTDGIYDAEAVRQFIAQNWERLGNIAQSPQKQRFAEHMRLKDLKRKADVQ